MELDILKNLESDRETVQIEILQSFKIGYQEVRMGLILRMDFNAWSNGLWEKMVSNIKPLTSIR